MVRSLDGQNGMPSEATLDNVAPHSFRGWMSTVVTTHVEAFLAVGRLRSFSAPARELGVSRAAGSQSVRQLEGQLGLVLLTRRSGASCRAFASGIRGSKWSSSS